jgi:hypothetical protein
VSARPADAVACRAYAEEWERARARLLGGTTVSTDAVSRAASEAEAAVARRTGLSRLAVARARYVVERGRWAAQRAANERAGMGGAASP